MKLFIVHGWTYTLDKWKDLAKELADEFEVVQLKLPGLTEPSDKVWNVPAYADWLEKQLEGEKEPVVIAHSNGGRIALAYAQKHPGRLGRLILIDSAGIKRSEARVSLKRKALKPIAKALKPLVKGKVRRGLYRVVGAKDYGNAPENMRETMKNMLAYDEQLDLSKVDVPVTIIWGEKDRATPVTDAYKLQRGIKNSSRPIIIEDAQHAPHASHPGLVADIIRRAAKETK